MPDWSKPVIEGALVRLRPYRADDADALWDMVNDAEGNDLTGTTATITRPQTDEWAASRADAVDRLDLVVEEIASGEYAGEVVINEYVEAGNAANFRISLRGPAWRGRGLGGEATRLIVDHAFAQLGLDAITLDVRADNVRGVRAYLSSGFQETHREDDDGHTWVYMSLTRERWEATQ